MSTLGRRRFSHDFKKLSAGDRSLALSGLPLQYLKKEVSLDQFNFNVVTLKYQERIITVDPKIQSQFLRDVLSKVNTIGQSALYTIGSFPTEQAAYELATIICRSYNEYKLSEAQVPDIIWIDLGVPDWSFLKDHARNPDIVVVHGVYDSSENQRLELARDFVRRSNSSTVFLLANTSNILDFTVNRIGTMPDVCWQLGKTCHRKAV